LITNFGKLQESCWGILIVYTTLEAGVEFLATLIYLLLFLKLLLQDFIFSPLYPSLCSKQGTHLQLLFNEPSLKLFNYD
jgi:hypothetical protein